MQLSALGTTEQSATVSVWDVTPEEDCPEYHTPSLVLSEPFFLLFSEILVSHFPIT